MANEISTHASTNVIELKSIFEVIPGNHVLLLANPPHFTILSVSDDYCLTAGRSKDEILGKDFLELFPTGTTHKEFAVITNTSLHQVIHSKHQDEIDLLRYGLLNHEGDFDERYWSFKHKPVLDDERNVQYIIHSAKDITDRVNIEQKQEHIKHLQQAHNLFMQAPIAIMILKGEDLIIDLANEPCIEYLDKGNNVIGKSLLELLPEIKQTDDWQMLHNVRTSQIPYQSFDKPVLLVRNEKLELFHFNVVMQPYYEQDSDTAVGVLIFATEVSERLAIKKELEESKRKFELAIEGAQLGIYTINFPDNTAIVSHKIVDWFSLDSTHTTFEKIIARIHPEDQLLVKRTIQNSLQANSNPRHDFVYRILDKENNKVCYLRSIGEVQYEGGKPKFISGILQDVTAQTESRRNIEESEARLNHLANAMPQVVWMAEPNGDVMYYNDRVREFDGARKLPKGKWIWESILHPDDTQGTMDAWSRSIENRSVYEKEHRIHMRDGTYRWHLSRAFPQKDEQGNVLQWYGTATDIHQQKMFEKQLQENEEHLASIFNQTSVGIAQTDLQGKFTLVNERYCEIVGRTKEELYELTTYDITHPDDLMVNVPMLERAAKEGIPFKYEKRYLRPNGTFVWVNINVSAVKDSLEKPLYVIGVCQDITERKIAEQALKESEQRFRTLADNAPMWVWMADEMLNITYVNTAFFKFVGLNNGNEFDASVFERVIHPDDLARVHEIFISSSSEHKPYEMECRFKNCHTDQYEWFHMSGVPRFDHETFSGFIGTGINIQAQKNILTQLETRVRERTKELNRANRALQQSNEDLQQFAHVASHDLKEPIRKIKTFCGRLEDDRDSRFSVRGKEYLTKINRATDRMASMVEGVLNYSTANASHQPIVKVNLNEILNDIECDLELLIQEKQATIRHEPLPELEGAPVLLYQLFYNLVNNSLKFAKRDLPLEVVISCSIAHGKNGEFAQIIFRDNGIGFEQEHAENIFNTFARLHPKDKYEGTGLGLSLCRKITRRHHGSIEATGKRDEGAEFRIVLPLLQREQFI